MASDEGTGRFGGGAMHLQLNKKVMSVFKALLVMFMFEKYKNVDKEDKEKIQHKESYKIPRITCRW